MPEKNLEPKFQEPTPYNPASDTWDDLYNEADEVLGHDLLKNEILDSLEGVPFLITRVIFRPADVASRESYVTCEAIIAPENVLKTRRVNLQTLPFDPGDHVVLNDGSTGIYRQIVAYLYSRGYIGLPEPIVPEGKANESSFDLPPDKWTEVHGGDLRYTPSGETVYSANIRLLAKRGIRISDYENEWTKDGKTRYLA